MTTQHVQDQPSQSTNPITFQPQTGSSDPNQPTDHHVTWSPSGSKEMESGRSSAPAEAGLSHAHVETELPKEVMSAGVSHVPTTVTLPPNLTNLGIQTVPPQTVTPQKESGPTLPLTDEQIAEGLHKEVFSSWRWFSEWCVRKLKQAHLAVKNVHGKFVRVHA